MSDRKMKLTLDIGLIADDDTDPGDIADEMVYAINEHFAGSGQVFKVEIASIEGWSQ